MPANDPNANALKIFPRNLTARSEQIIRGNPANSRPESGVQNCFPGLELDLRNIEQVFLRGLTFEFHRDDGAILTRVDSPIHSFTPAEIKDRPLYLWAMYGSIVKDGPPSLWGFKAQNGLEVWSRIHDLAPDRVAVLLGPAPGFSNPLDADTAETILKALYDGARNITNPMVEMTMRGETDNLIQYVAICQNRTQYVDTNGVLGESFFPPGELTKSLCAPWVYDFRDCVCFYWASNKPDIVDSENGQQTFVNFLRQTSDRTANPPQDVTLYRGRRNLELTYEEMIGGWWEKLPVVLNDRESTSFSVTPPPSLTEFLTPEQVVSELTYLATVEHALLVEYLYAVYSTKAGRLPATDQSDVRAQAIYAATNEIFRVAVEEMKHFRWVNEILKLLGAPPSVDRAQVIGAPPAPGSGRKMDMKRQYLASPFELRPLTRQTLDWFIDVEAPSQVANQDLDGMYVAILESIHFQPELFKASDRVLPMIKLIIDEGQGHFHRFTRVKKALANIPEADYLRTLSTNPHTTQQSKLLDICDAYYHSIEEVIQITFTLGDLSGGMLLNAAVRTMENLHEAAYLLASEGVLPMFNRPSIPPGTKRLSHAESLSMLEKRATHIQDSLQSLEETGTFSEKQLATQQMAKAAILYQRMQEIVRGATAEQ